MELLHAKAWRHNLLKNYERLGDLLTEAGFVDEAVEFYRKALTIRQSAAQERE